MINDIIKGVRAFNARIREDHLGAYAASCAFFLIISFTPLTMIMLAIVRLTVLNETAMMNNIMLVVPAGIRDYVSMIINEVYTKTYGVVPISVIVLLWSASKTIHALTNSLNVINRVRETRGWVYTRLRSMLVIVILLLGLGGLSVLKTLSLMIGRHSAAALTAIEEILFFLMPFRNLLGYIIMILLFMLIYVLLPNGRYTFRSQFPGALMVATIWTIVSYFLTLYYMHNRSFSSIYGSLTGIILAMIWLYFCMYFLLLGAEINRIIAENPEDNVIMNTIQDVRTEAYLRGEASRREQERIKSGNDDEDHDLDEETGIDLSLVRQVVYQHEDIMEDEDD
ncbi:MAG: YihY/virulence factor BrkB family protein [Lachnospiraceae bacterium]|nr:YihY/virulence factor BrkB family protein [Lachnospiraceae bacterium]